MAYLLALVIILNYCIKFGSASTRDEQIFSFNASNSFFLPPHWKTCFTLVNACNGAVIEEKLEINFLQYWVAPKKFLNSINFLGFGQFKMKSTLEGSIFNSPPPTIWPKYTKEVFPNSHFDIFKNNCSFFKTSSTSFLTCVEFSSQYLLKIKTPSN